MKKIWAIITIFILSFFLNSCGLLKNKYVEKPNGVDITILEEYKEHMLVLNTIPVIHFDYPNVRISTDSTNALVTFVQNDPYQFSDAFASHLATYRDDQIIETRVVEREEKKGAKFGNDYLPIDNGNKSLEKIIIATLDDGTRVSYSFRTFTSNGKVYYAYTYIENIKIGLEMPLMCVQDDNTRKLVLLPLPYDTKYIVGSNTDLDKLLKKDEYLSGTSEDYYTFSYPLYLREKSMDKEVLINELMNWYQTHCHLEEVDGNYFIEYLGVKFQIYFNLEKMNNDTEMLEPAFKLQYVAKN